MLSLFPSLLTWQQLSPLLIRVVLGAVFLYMAYCVFRDKSSPMSTKAAAIIEAVSGVLLVIGLWSQLAAMIIAIDLVVRMIGKIKNRAFLTNGVNYYILLMIMAISIMVTGAGFIAFDYPL